MHLGVNRHEDLVQRHVGADIGIFVVRTIEQEKRRYGGTKEVPSFTPFASQSSQNG